MHYLLFSDVHGNAAALMAMLKKAENMCIDGYIYCGDIAGYYYDASQVVEILSSLHPLYIVKGNHDELYRRVAYGEIDEAGLIEKYGSSYGNIDSTVLSYVEKLPERITVSLSGRRVMLLHGSPQDPLNGRIYPDTPLGAAPAGVDLICCGHTHYQMYRKWGNCDIINPGSLGQPRDGKGFSFCIWDGGRGTAQFDTVQFDLSHLAKKIVLYDNENDYLRKILYRKRSDFG